MVLVLLDFEKNFLNVSRFFDISLFFFGILGWIFNELLSFLFGVCNILNKNMLIN